MLRFLILVCLFLHKCQGFGLMYYAVDIVNKIFFSKKGVLIFFFKQKQVWELDCKYKKIN